MAGDCLEAQKELERFLSDRQIELHNQEVRRKEEERIRMEQAEERKKQKMYELQTELSETKDVYLTTANKVGWGISAIVVILIWNWLSFWKFVLFGWIMICIAIPVVLGIAKSIAESAYDSLRKKKESEIENS